MARTSGSLPTELVRQVQDGGYYPDLVLDVLDVAVGGEPITGRLVQAETTFDTDTVRRHLSVMVLTPTRLIVVHVDDHGDEDDEHGHQPHGLATSESVALSAIRSVAITHVVADPQRYRRGALGREVTIAINWGGVQRLDLERASCGDPSCEADHGYTGSVMTDDLALRISLDAEGSSAMSEAIAFARALSAATAGGQGR